MALSIDNRFIRKTIEKSLRDLPALPTVVMRVLQETEKPDVCAAGVEKLICSDQALTMKVLRVVNSAYYGLSGQVASLNQALVILGMQQVRNLVLSVAAIETLQPKTPRQHETMKQFWMHAFGSGAAAQSIAHEKRMPSKDVELIFLGALLHDVGRLYLFCNFTEAYDEVMEYAAQSGVSMDEAELKFLGITHAEVGKIMAETWRFPEALVRLIGEHEGNFTDGGSPDVFTVHIADQVMKDAYLQEYVVTCDALDPQAMAWLGYTDEQLMQLREETQVKIDEALELYGLMAA